MNSIEQIFDATEKLGAITRAQVENVMLHSLLECEAFCVPIEDVAAIVVELANKGQIGPDRTTQDQIGLRIRMLLNALPRNKLLFDFLQEHLGLSGESIAQIHGPRLGVLMMQLLCGGQESLTRMQECSDRLKAI